jgi:UDP-N-acetylmuramate dehydrogenase
MDDVILTVEKSQKEILLEEFGDRVRVDIDLSKFTSARIGGPADIMMIAETSEDLEKIVTKLWVEQIPYRILGGGTNILISDAGVREVVVLNRARQIRFNDEGDSPSVWAESGANFSSLARKAESRGLSGLEWATGIPGTVGGAVVGNAGAHSEDIAGNLLMAEILHHNFVRDDLRAKTIEISKEFWAVERLDYSYRSSILKRKQGASVVISATIGLKFGDCDQIKEKIDEFTHYRRSTQPAGASMGSMFKNPVNDSAGRLIEASGLKSTRIGDAQISEKHANFFINHGEATAEDVYGLIELSKNSVFKKFGVELELEIELFGDWDLPRYV